MARNNNNNTKNRNIKIVAGKEYRVHIIDEKSDISKDFFYDVHCNAFKEVSKIVEENKTIENEQKSIVEASNNIICFCGERGQGKSSAMLSFSNMLRNISDDNIKKYFSEYIKEIVGEKFYIINRIDPTELENQQSILSVILSRMFFVFKEYLLKDNEIDIIKKNEILDLFQQCYKNISLIKSDEKNKNEYYFNDDIEILSNLSDSVNIKNDFYKLVRTFLEYVVKENWLVIQIDDTDLNVKDAYDIVEDIRKYFMMPRVIVLMATKMDQLTKAIEQKYVKSFSSLVKAKRIPLREFHNMATKYIGKLIPGSRCMILPRITLEDTSASDENLTIEYEGYKKRRDEPEISLSGPLQEIVLKIINDKTGLIFVKQNNGLHNIIPKTARGLANFLSILNSMDNLEVINSVDDLENKQDIYLRLKNLNKFEEYFLNTWVEENIDVRFVQAIKDWSVAPWETKNKLIVYKINEYKLFPELYMESAKRRRSLYYANMNLYTIKMETNSFDVSDVLDILSKMDEYYPESSNYNLCFAIRVLYSIMLNKLLLVQFLKGSNKSIRLIGSIYSEEKINSFMRKEGNKYSRAEFSFRLSNKDYVKWYNSLTDNERIINKLFLKEVESKDDKKRSLSEYLFNVASPMIQVLQPYELLCADENSLENSLFKSKYKELQYTCFQIVANTDVLLKLEKELARKPDNIPAIDPIEHIIDLYQRIETCIKEIGFIKQESFVPFLELLSQSKDWVNYVYDKRYITVNTYINEYSSMLQPYEKTTTFDLLKERLFATQATFDEITELDLVDLSFETQTIKERITKLLKSQKVTPSSCKTAQAEINKMRKSALEKLKNLEG